MKELRDARFHNRNPGPQDQGEETANPNGSRLGYGATIVEHLTDGLQLNYKIKSELIGDLIANIYGSEEDNSNFSDASRIHLSDERRSVLEQLFISRLYYDSMQERELTIKDAHKGTFRWIFEENDPTGFKSWLVSDEPLYWITGKPGSGKSTLMRYLLQPIIERRVSNATSIAELMNQESTVYRHSRCAKYLEQWAGKGHELTIVSFHFWAVGSELQSSQEGLYRTLLVQLLSAHPEVIPLVAPLRWEALCLFNIDPQNFSQIDLGDMFRKAIVHISAHNKLAIFIDGLDEFEGDCYALISLVQSCVVSPIKICVSSRHWNEFEDAFGDGPGLEMQNLTHKDISKYVSSKFEGNVQFRSLQRRQPHVAKGLFEAIVKKSSGVFLWVTVVVASLLTGIGAGDRVEDLHMRLGQLPEEIEKLYQRILENVDSGYLEHTAQLLQLMAAFKVHPPPLLFWYADEVNFMDRAIKENALNVSHEELLDRVEDIRRRLNSRCKGLLEIYGSTTSSSDPFSPGFVGHINYLHKSVYEFISSPKTQRRLQSYLKTSYDAHLRIAAAFATVIKGTMRRIVIDLLGNSKAKDSRSSSLIWCLGHAANASHESRNEVVRLLDHITSLYRDNPEDIDFGAIGSEPYMMKDAPKALRARSLFNLDCLGYLNSRQKMLCLASLTSVVAYVKARARPSGLITVQPPTLDPSRGSLVNLIERVFDKWSGHWNASLLSLVCLSNPNGASILKHLLEKGANPNMRLTIINESYVRVRMTPWEEILAVALRYCVKNQGKNKDKDNVLRCVRQMVDGGAKVDLKTVKTARERAGVGIDAEEVYRCLKHMKADLNAQFDAFWIEEVD